MAPGYLRLPHHLRHPVGGGGCIGCLQRGASRAEVSMFTDCYQARERGRRRAQVPTNSCSVYSSSFWVPRWYLNIVKDVVLRDGGDLSLSWLSRGGRPSPPMCIQLSLSADPPRQLFPANHRMSTYPVACIFYSQPVIVRAHEKEPNYDPLFFKKCDCIWLLLPRVAHTRCLR